MKKCSKCLKVKELTEFNRNNTKKDGFSGVCRVCMKYWTKQWRLKNKAKINAAYKKYYRKHWAAKQAYSKQYAKEHREELKVYKRDYCRRMRISSVQFRLQERMRIRCRRAFNGTLKDSMISYYLGCDREHFLKHLRLTLKKGLTWADRNDYDIDHIIPLNAYNLLTTLGRRRCSHYTNLQLLPPIENKRKRDQVDIV